MCSFAKVNARSKLKVTVIVQTSSSGSVSTKELTSRIRSSSSSMSDAVEDSRTGCGTVLERPFALEAGGRSEEEYEAEHFVDEP